MITDLIAAVQRHAEANYETGGWDIVVEAMDREEIGQIIFAPDATAETEAEAIAAMEPVVALLAEHRAETEATAF